MGHSSLAPKIFVLECFAWKKLAMYQTISTKSGLLALNRSMVTCFTAGRELTSELLLKFLQTFAFALARGWF
jgi:hypothetical protein